MKNTQGIAAVKSAGVVVAATIATLMATAGPAYASAGFSSVPMDQSPTQICNNNFGSNTISGSGNRNKIKSKNSGSCKQKTSSRNGGSNTTQSPTQICNNNFGSNTISGSGNRNKIKSKNSGSCKQKTSSR